MLPPLKRVFIVYKFLPHYRVSFYNELKETLLAEGVELNLLYGKSNSVDALKNDETELDWAQYVPNRRYYLGRSELLWQPCLKYLEGADLVIVQWENKLLLNYYLMLARRFRSFKLAVWGHVYNMQDDINSRGNKIKLALLHYCDWWFCYTAGSKEILTDKGFPENKITVVQNAIDTIALMKYYREIRASDVSDLSKALGITGNNVGIYCGGMYPHKDLDFILQTCYLVKDKIPDFHMLFIGSGIDSHKVQAAAEQHNWIHFVGPKFGKDRVIYFKIASLQLMPALVGLCILDSFAMETPLVTTDSPLHSPEIEYLENGINGLMTKYNLEDYSGLIIDLLKEKKYLDFIQAGKASAERYSNEAMIRNFKDGILKCL